VIRVSLALFLLGCGRVGFDAAANGDGGSVDAAVDARPDASYTARRWELRSNASQPGRLIPPKLVYHPGRGRVLLYGGRLESGARSSAFWELGPTGWTVICDPCTPGPRDLAALGYDPVRDRVLLYGGDNTVGQPNQLWEWDGTTWTESTAPSLPGARERGAWIYEATRQRMLFIGGAVGGVETDDVFTFDGSQFTQLTVVAPKPAIVAGDGTFVMFDPARGVLALRDDGANSTFDEVWQWTNDAWSRLCASCTGQGRSAASLVHDPVLGANYLINGFIVGSGEIDGTWIQQGASFAMISQQPEARDSSGVVYDEARDVIVLYGGNGPACGGNCDETWELVPDLP
jgi:hypothetical protein